MVSRISSEAQITFQPRQVDVTWLNKQVSLIWDFECEPLKDSSWLDGKTDFSTKLDPNPLFGWLGRWVGGFVGQIGISTYIDMPGFVMTGRLLPDEQDREIHNLPLFHLDFSKREAQQLRWLVNSGSQGFSGSIGVGQQVASLSTSQDVTVLAWLDHAFALGNLSFNRTNLIFRRSLLDGGDIRISAFLDYGSIILPAGEELPLEIVYLCPAQDALLALETYADRVVELFRPKFNRSLTGLYNQWYANWTPTSDHGSAELALEGGRLLLETGLDRYGIRMLGSGVWHNRAAFGEEEAWPGLFPEGLDGLGNRLQQMGLQFMHGGFWGKASSCSTLFRQHPDWMAKDQNGRPMQVENESWGACRYPYYIPDITRPEVHAWYRQQWSIIKQAASDVYWLDFFGTGTGIDLENKLPEALFFADRRYSFPFETDRLLTGLIRDEIGERGILGVYTSPTFNLIGLIDRARVALDCGAIDPPISQATDGGTGNTVVTNDAARRWLHIQAVARNLAAMYFCHGRFWMNDPDPAMVGLVDRPETLEEARVRVMLAANSGGFVTVGEAPDRIPPGRMRLLKQILPPLGKAARPLDLFHSDVPEMYDLTVEADWDCWQILTLINWKDHPQEYHLEFQRLGLPETCHVFEFWQHEYSGIHSRKLDTVVPPASCRVFCLRQPHQHPWIVATDMHVTMGGVELSNVSWNPALRVLSGRAYRPDGSGTLWISLSPGFSPSTARENGLPVPFEIGHELVALSLSFHGEPIEWTIDFDEEA